MKKVVIPVPVGYDAIQIEVPEEFVHLLRTRAVKMADFQRSSTIVIFEHPTPITNEDNLK